MLLLFNFASIFICNKIHYVVCIKFVLVVKTENSEIASIGALIFQLHILYKAWQISLTSLVVIYISCPLVQGRRSHLKATRALVHDTWQASLPKQRGNFQHHYLCMHELLCDGANCILLLCECYMDASFCQIPATLLQGEAITDNIFIQLCGLQITISVGYQTIYQ